MPEKRRHPVIAAELCKGCGKCVPACPRKVLAIGARINAKGYRHAVYAGEGCVGCGNCFYACPEPAAITIVEGPGAGRQTREQEGDAHE